MANICKNKPIYTDLLGDCEKPNIGSFQKTGFIPFDYVTGYTVDALDKTGKVVTNITRKFKREFFNYKQTSRNSGVLIDNQEEGDVFPIFIHGFNGLIQAADEFAQDNLDRLAGGRTIVVARDKNQRYKILGENSGLKLITKTDQSDNETSQGLAQLEMSTNEESASARLLRLIDRATDPTNPSYDLTATTTVFDTLFEPQGLVITGVTVGATTVFTVASTAEMQEYLDFEGSLDVSFKNFTDPVLSSTLNGITPTAATILSDTTFSVAIDTTGGVFGASDAEVF